MTINFSDIKSKELASGIVGKYIHSENMTIGFVQIKKGATLPLHSHIHEQITQILKGELEMTFDGEKKILTSESITIIPSNCVHSAIALTDCEVIDTFYPAREDYK